MKIFFKTRKQAREYTGKGKVVDCGTFAEVGKRWAVEVPLKPRKPWFLN